MASLFTLKTSDGTTTYYSKVASDTWGEYGSADKTISASEEHIDLVDNNISNIDKLLTDLRNKQ